MGGKETVNTVVVDDELTHASVIVVMNSGKVIVVVMDNV